MGLVGSPVVTSMNVKIAYNLHQFSTLVMTVEVNLIKINLNILPFFQNFFGEVSFVIVLLTYFEVPSPNQI